MHTKNTEQNRRVLLRASVTTRDVSQEEDDLQSAVAGDPTKTRDCASRSCCSEPPLAGLHQVPPAIQESILTFEHMVN